MTTLLRTVISLGTRILPESAHSEDIFSVPMSDHGLTMSPNLRDMRPWTDHVAQPQNTPCTIVPIEPAFVQHASVSVAGGRCSSSPCCPFFSSLNPLELSTLKRVGGRCISSTLLYYWGICPSNPPLNRQAPFWRDYSSGTESSNTILERLFFFR
jgi:hypothetical protein